MRKKSISRFCQFASSVLVGFILGSYMTRHSEQPIRQRRHRYIEQSSQYSSSEMMKVASATRYRQGLLYIGVMSTTGNLHSRVAAMLNTWARRPRVKIEIFAINNDSISYEHGNGSKLEYGINIITLPNVSDVSYPPQKKSFSMLKYIYDNHLDNFEWFLRADDDSYIKIEELVRFLSKIDSIRPFLIGLPGYGKHEEDYLFGENYCMGGNGIFLSRALQIKVGPKLSTCIRQMYTEHEDIEISRCVRTVAGIGCVSAWEASSLFYQHYGESATHPDSIGELSDRIRADALTFHANKDPKYQFKLHLSVLSDQVKDSLLRISQKSAEAKAMESVILEEGALKDRIFEAESLWSDINNTEIYSATSNIVSAIPSTLKRTLSDTTYSSVSAELQRTKQLLSLQISEVVIRNAKYHVTPLSSEDIIANVEVRMQSDQDGCHKKKVHIRRSFPSSVIYFNEPHDLYQAFSGYTSDRGKSEADIAMAEKINFVLALSGRLENFQRFLDNFGNGFLSTGENVGLTVVYYPQNSSQSVNKFNHSMEPPINLNSQVKSEIDFVQSLLNSLSQQYSQFQPNLISMSNTSFSRGAGLQIGTSNILNNELLFFCDVDLVFSSQLLSHIRRNTIKGKQVYYPTFFSQYDPEIVFSSRKLPQSSFDFKEVTGFWRTFSYGMIAIYKDDFMKAGGFDLSIQGWGLEDVRLCDAILKNTELQIFKANEPALVHIYHDKDCLSDLAPQQREACQKSRAHHFGAQTFLYYVWQREQERVKNISTG